MGWGCWAGLLSRGQTTREGLLYIYGVELGWVAPISRSDKMASREFGGGADITGACERVGGYARSVKNHEQSYFSNV